MITGARTPLTVDLTGHRVAISAGANGMVHPPGCLFFRTLTLDD